MKLITRSIILPSFTVAFMSIALQVQAQPILNIDFNQKSNPDPPLMSGAAVIGSDGDIWNGVKSESGTTPALSYNDGTLSAITLTHVTGQTFSTDISTQSPFDGTADYNLMRDYYFDSSGSDSETLSLNNLTPNGFYDIYFYSGANTNGRETDFTVDSQNKTATFSNAFNTFEENVNYVLFESVQVDGSGDLVFTFSSSTEPNLNGLQLIAIPELSHISLILASSCLILLYFRKRRRS